MAQELVGQKGEKKNYVKKINFSLTKKKKRKTKPSYTRVL
jgi:hypothetical protein